ncbi:MAG: DUF4392 domain-containing protein [Firmicutes bacterium]|nr:DUF4392 domain-containing protein [Bacillota bacterium]
MGPWCFRQFQQPLGHIHDLPLLRLAVAAGSVDGCTKKNEMTVDRLDLETHLGILDSVNDILKKELDICAIA